MRRRVLRSTGRRRIRAISLAATVVLIPLILRPLGDSWALTTPFAPHAFISPVRSGLYRSSFVDMDRDGDPDVLTVSTNDDTIAWHENLGGNGSLWAERIVTTDPDGSGSQNGFADSVNAAFAGDLDGDGDPDIASSSGSGGSGGYKIAWYENTTGDGSTWVPTAILTGNPIFPRLGGLVDMDRDGDLDILATGTNSVTFMRAVFWLENVAGDASTWNRHDISSDAPLTDVSTAVDVDGDGDPDIIVSDNGALRWYENLNGSAMSWSTPQTMASGGNSQNTLQISDIDRDGDADAVGTVAGNQLNFVRNLNGLGTSWDKLTVFTPIGAVTTAVADPDEDGDLDVFSGQGCGVCTMINWHENGNGTGTSWTIRSISSSFSGPMGFSAGDLDGDGDADLVALSTSIARAAWFRNKTIRRNAAFPSRQAISTAVTGASTAVTGDVDGDGDVDVVSASAAGGAIAWHANVNGTGTSWTTTSIGTTPQGASALFPIDVDRDGDVDVLAALANDDRIAWYENAGSGNGTSWVARDVWNLADGASSAVAADVDRDGDPDVLSASTGNDTIAWHENTAGDGSAWTPHTVTAVAAGASAVLAADMDRDGDFDALSASAGNDTVAWHESTAGDGSAWSEHLVTTAADGPASVAAADLDRDGDPDVLVASTNDDTVAWYENTSGDATTWTQHVLTVAADGVVCVRAADVDGDGDLDVVSASPNDDTVAWYENQAGDASVWVRLVSPAAADGARAVAVADVDGDGRSDLLSASANDATIGWYRNRGGQFTPTAADVAPPFVLQGTSRAVLRYVPAHNGRAGDTDLELLAIGLFFEESPGDLLTTAEANALIERIVIYRDTGSGVLEPQLDTPVKTIEDLSLVGGGQVFGFTDGDPNVRVAQGASMRFFVALEFAPGAASIEPNTVRVTLLSSSTTAEDADTDISLTQEPVANIVSKVVEAVGPGSDRDGDGLYDYNETDTGVFASGADTGTDPLVADTDGDGFSDGQEVTAGSNPNNPDQTPNNIPTLGMLGCGVLALGLAGSAIRILRGKRGGLS